MSDTRNFKRKCVCMCVVIHQFGLSHKKTMYSGIIYLNRIKWNHMQIGYYVIKITQHTHARTQSQFNTITCKSIQWTDVANLNSSPKSRYRNDEIMTILMKFSSHSGRLIKIYGSFSINGIHITHAVREHIAHKSCSVSNMNAFTRTEHLLKRLIKTIIMTNKLTYCRLSCMHSIII